MSLKIPIAHDFSCPWCYVAIFQMERLKREFDVEFEWVGYELWPVELERPVFEPRREIPNRPPVPSRLDLMLAAEDLEVPKIERPKNMGTHNVHLATEFAREHGLEETFAIEAYRAHWERGEDIDEIEFLADLGSRIGLGPLAMRESIEAEQFAERVIHFDAPAYKTGIFNVPTFTIEGNRYAEQPYRVLQRAVAEAVGA